MSDKSKIDRAKRLRINAGDAYQIAHWTEKFGLTAMQLKAAVKAAGSPAADVERNLNMGKS